MLAQEEQGVLLDRTHRQQERRLRRGWWTKAKAYSGSFLKLDALLFKAPAEKKRVIMSFWLTRCFSPVFLPSLSW
jgi:hypothetical protein